MTDRTPELLKGLNRETGEEVEIGPPHPIAALFPLQAGDDLDELTASIQEQGLLQPIMLDTSGRVLDGRNRLAVCERLGLLPEVTYYDGDDPDGYAFTVNMARRHLSKGQIAIVAARALCETHNGNQDKMAKAVKVSQSRISLANVVLTYAPELADGIIAGTHRLDDALTEARTRKQAKIAEADRLAELRAKAPDLADRITDDDDPMALSEAIHTYHARERARKEAQEAGKSSARVIVGELRAHVTLIISGIHAGAEDVKVTPEMVREGREALDLLEEWIR